MEEVKKQGMESLFCPYELALELKELGFDEECLALYQSNHNNKPFININDKINIEALLSGKIKNEGIQYLTKAPLWQQAFDWFRNEHNLWSWIHKSASRPYNYHYSILKDARVYVEPDNNKSTYEEARLECIKKLIEIIKNESK